MKIKKLSKFLLLLIGLSLISIPSARAEEIPVLVWERGQEQNIVLGQGDSNQSWDIYLKNSKGINLKANRSTSNQDNFSVYSITLPNDLPVAGYVVEAIGSNGEVKQVAGVQVIEATSKVITRVPFELFLLVLGISIFFFLLQRSRGIHVGLKEVHTPSLSEISFTDRLTNIFLISLQKDSKTSLMKILFTEGCKNDFKARQLTFVSGIIGLVIISYLQFVTGNWSGANSWIIILVLALGNISATYGVVLGLLSFAYLLLNITLAKTISEVLAIIVLSSVFMLPSLYNVFLNNLFRTVLMTNFKTSYNEIAIKILSSFLAALSCYQLLLLYESLGTSVGFKGFSKEILALLLWVIFSVKNLSDKNQDFVEKIQIARPIGPKASLVLTFFTSIVIYLWTTNLFISLIAAISIFSILALNWLKFKISDRFRVRDLGILYILALILTSIFAIFLSTRVLPLDVINRSHLLILLIFPMDLILAIYLALSHSDQYLEVRK